MFSPVIIIIAIVVVILIIIGSYVKPGKNVRREIPGKDENLFVKDETFLPKVKKTFGSQQKTFPKTSGLTLCKTCKGTKKIKCNRCYGFGYIRTTRVGPSTTIGVAKVRTVYDSKGKPTYQHYTETQVKPGKVESINLSCGPCLGSGKVKCPNC
jgi:hypothetical protein